MAINLKKQDYMYIYFHKQHVISNQNYFNSIIDKTHDYIVDRFCSKTTTDNDIKRIKDLIEKLNRQKIGKTLWKDTLDTYIRQHNKNQKITKEEKIEQRLILETLQRYDPTGSVDYAANEKVGAFDTKSTGLSSLIGRVNKDGSFYWGSSGYGRYSAQKIYEILLATGRYILTISSLKQELDQKLGSQSITQVEQELKEATDRLSQALKMIQDQDATYSVFEDGKRTLHFRPGKENWKEVLNIDLRYEAQMIAEEIANFQEKWKLTDRSRELQGLLGERQLYQAISSGIKKAAQDSADKAIMSVEHTAYDKSGVYGSKDINLIHWNGRTDNITGWLKQNPTQNKADLVFTIQDDEDDTPRNLGLSVKAYSADKGTTEISQVGLVDGTPLTALLAFDINYFNTFANYYNVSIDNKERIVELNKGFYPTLDKLILQTKQIIILQGLIENFYKIQNGAQKNDLLFIKNVTTGKWSCYRISDIVDIILSNNTKLEDYFYMKPDINRENRKLIINKWVVAKEGQTGEDAALKRNEKVIAAYKKQKITVDMKMRNLQNMKV